MICFLCKQDYPNALGHVADPSGLMQPVCLACAKPKKKLADGSHQGKVTVVAVQHRNAGDNTFYPVTDFADHEEARLVELRTAQAQGLAQALHDVLAIVRHIGGYMTPEQQATLREARALLAEAGL